MRVEADIRSVSIHIGGVFASRRPAVVSTVLGSCVAACLFDPCSAIGGMNHFMLPACQGDDGLPTRYGVNAMEVLINRIMKLGGDRRRLKAKLFGGANVLSMDNPLLRIGEQNARFARQFLLAEGIPILGERVGGCEPLQIYCYTDTARVLVRALRTRNASKLAEREVRYLVELTQSLPQLEAKSVTLF